MAHEASSPPASHAPFPALGETVLVGCTPRGMPAPHPLLACRPNTPTTAHFPTNINKHTRGGILGGMRSCCIYCCGLLRTLCCAAVCLRYCQCVDGVDEALRGLRLAIGVCAAAAAHVNVPAVAAASPSHCLASSEAGRRIRVSCCCQPTRTDLWNLSGSCDSPVVMSF